MSRILIANSLALHDGIVLFKPVEELLDGLDRHGWATMRDGVDDEGSRRLRRECQDACDLGAFHQAGVGRGEGKAVRTEIRSDRVLWLQPGAESVEQANYLAKLGLLRLALNQRFFLGLCDFELIEPRMGTLVCFMAGDFWHEVLPATDQRTSIAGWFRQR